MQVKDTTQWAQQEMELQADEMSRKFLGFFQTLITYADQMYDENNSDTSTYSAVSAIRWAFAATEQELGFISMEWMGQLVLLASQHWVHGDEMVAGLTNLERRMLEQMTAIKMVELQEQANQV